MLYEIEKLSANIVIRDEQLFLLPEKAIYWPSKKMLLIADLHIGKSGHFQKNGIPVPSDTVHQDLKVIEELLDQLPIEQIVIVGDLFHSESNAEWQPFETWRTRNSHVSMQLVMGNHEILPEKYYQVLDLETCEYLSEGPFLFVHDTSHQYDLFSDQYRIGGHVHPAIRMRGKGRQSFKFSCFYFADDFALLPAFGSFTGNYLVKPKEGEKTFAIVEKRVIEC